MRPSVRLCLVLSWALNSVYGGSDGPEQLQNGHLHDQEELHQEHTQSGTVNDGVWNIVLADDNIDQAIVMNMQKEIMVEFVYTIRCGQDETMPYFINVKSYSDAVLTIDPIPPLDGDCGQVFTNINDLDTDIKVNVTNLDAKGNSSNDHRSFHQITDSVNVTLRSGIIGLGTVEFSFVSQDVNATSTFDVIVVRELQLIDTVFQVTVYCLEIMEMIGFGSQLDLEVVKKTLKKPVAPIIGFACQYIIMPLIAYCVAKVIEVDPLAALGIFVTGCCPGGQSSNIYAYLLRGDLSLSITVTTMSTLAALFMMPLWLYTLGAEFLHGHDVTIPFESIFISLSVLVLPLIAGMLIQHKFPKAALVIQKALTPVITVFAICLLVTGIYANLYIFRLFQPRLIMAGCLLPYAGFILGGLVTLASRQSWTIVKTLAIETGLQNSAIGFILLSTSFEAPLGDIAAVAPIAAEVMTPLPVFLITIGYLFHSKVSGKYKTVERTEDDLEEKDSNSLV